MRNRFEKYLFISDCHLGGFSEVENQRIALDFLQVLNWALENEYKVVLLGDIFDYWMEFDSGFYPQEFDYIIKKLKTVIQKQGPILYITGNHDNWSKGFWESIGVDIESDFRIEQFEGQQTLLMHGDGLLFSNKKLKRPLFHQLLRNKDFVSLFQWLFRNRTGLTIMRYFAKANRYISEFRKPNTNKLDRWFKEYSSRLGVENILCGHDHIARCIRLNDCKYLNLGAFYKQKTFVLYTEKQFHLVLWNSEQKQPKLYS